MEEPRIASYERQRYMNLGFRVKLIDGKVVKTELTEEEKKQEELYAKDILSAFIPKEKL